MMREYMTRLIKCGMPREVAYCVCRIFIREKGYSGLEQYVFEVEEEMREREVDEW